jgi:hypothetical protein
MHPARPSRLHVLAATGVVAGALAGLGSNAPLADAEPAAPSVSARSVSPITPLTPVDLDRRHALAASTTLRKEAAIRAAKEAAVAARAAKVRASAERASRSRRLAPTGSPHGLAVAMLADRGWSDEWDCLNRLWHRESRWDVGATNASSGAYGIPQALPASKMASAGDDWRTNPVTQIRWGLGYIAERYGSPCPAWRHSLANNWY